MTMRLGLRQLWRAGLAAGTAIALLGMTPAMAQKVVNVWHTEPNNRTKAVIDGIIADFEKANPGVKVVQEALAWGDLDKKMQAALASNSFPEIAHGQAYNERSLSAKGLLRPMNDVIAAIGEQDIFPVVRKLNYNEKTKTYYGLAHAVGIGAIAEGVENDAQRQHLLALGCDLAQGYLWSRPMPAASITALLEDR